MKKSIGVAVLVSLAVVAGCKPAAEDGALSRAGAGAVSPVKSADPVPPCAQDPIPEDYNGPMCPN